jgi:hypothetical protein
MGRTQSYFLLIEEQADWVSFVVERYCSWCILQSQGRWWEASAQEVRKALAESAADPAALFLGLRSLSTQPTFRASELTSNYRALDIVRSLAVQISPCRAQGNTISLGWTGIPSAVNFLEDGVDDANLAKSFVAEVAASLSKYGSRKMSLTYAEPSANTVRVRERIVVSPGAYQAVSSGVRLRQTLLSKGEFCISLSKTL